MPNHLLSVTTITHSAVPAQAEIHVWARPASITPATEVRGRLMGPRCPYASTIEISYPLRPLRDQSRAGELGARVLVPEASLWDPISPFLYEGPVELWQDGLRTDRAIVRHGLRRFTLGPSGLRINGAALQLRGRRVTGLAEAEAVALRQEGINLLLAPVREESRPIWEVADRLGFLVLGEMEELSSPLPASLARHASALGWLVPAVSPSPQLPGFVGQLATTSAQSVKKKPLTPSPSPTAAGRGEQERPLSPNPSPTAAGRGEQEGPLSPSPSPTEGRGEQDLLAPPSPLVGEGGGGGEGDSFSVDFLLLDSEAEVSAVPSQVPVLGYLG